MLLSLKHIFVPILLFGFFNVAAQSYLPSWEALRERSDKAMDEHNMPLYLKLAYEEYNLTASHHDTALMIKAYIKLTDYYSRIKLNNDSANVYRNKGVYLAHAAKNLEAEMDFGFMQAAQYAQSGRLVEAHALFQRLDPVVSSHHFDFAPFFNSAYARLLISLKEYAKASDRFKKAVIDFQKEGLSQDLAVTYVNIATAYSKMDDTDSSLAYLNKALKVNQERKDTTGIAECYTRFGILYGKEGQNEKAHKYYKLAFDLNPVNPSDPLIANYTKVLITEKKFKEAELLLTNLKKQEAISPQLIALASLIRLKEAEGAYKEALAYSEEYNEKREELLDIEKIEQIEELETQYEVANKESQIAFLHEINKHQEKTFAQNRIIFYVSIVLLLAALFVVFLLYRNRAIRLKAEQILLEQQLLRTQMNPHFIFNCLANIQSTVLQKERVKAASYIAVFSKLVRSILENSIQSKVLFSDELSALKDYLILQKIRYNDRFDYEIEVDESVEEDMISIPPMLFQPIVENAIEHGVVEKSDGMIHIHFEQQERYIRCTVSDNGVGYGNSIHSAETMKKKTSLSTQITKRRLAILAKHIKQSLGYKVTVLHDEDGNATGTKVEIDIPILS